MARHPQLHFEGALPPSGLERLGRVVEVERRADEALEVQAVLEERDCNGLTPLASACFHSNTAVAEALLDAGADPNTPTDGDLTPLMLSMIISKKFTVWLS